MFTRCTALGSTQKLALSFKEYNRDSKNNIEVIPPLLRQSIFSLTPSDKNYILGYMVNNGYAEEIVSWHKKNTTTKVHLFWDRKQQKEQTAKQRKMDNERNRWEALIETLEGQVEQLEQKMANPIICSNSVKLQEISNELIATQAKLLDAYEKWEEIS